MKDKDVMDTSDLKADPVDSNNHDEIKPKVEGNKYADNQFFGPWFTYKTTHSIVINGNNKDSVPSMSERLQMVKPFEITPVDKKLKK